MGREVERDEREEREPCARDEREEEHGQGRLREPRDESVEAPFVARRELYVVCRGHAAIV